MVTLQTGTDTAFAQPRKAGRQATAHWNTGWDLCGRRWYLFGPRQAKNGQEFAE